MRKIYKAIGIVALAVSSLFVNSQVNLTQNFNAGGTPAGWTVASFAQSTTLPCEGAGSMRRNFWSSGTTGSLTSPTQTATGFDIDVSFTYKIVEYHASNPTTPQTGNWGTMAVQYSINGGTDWITHHTINEGNHTPSATCAPYNFTLTGVDVPNGSDFRVRFTGTWISGDYFFYIDEFSMFENVPCPGVSGVNASNILTNSADITWSSGATAFNIEWSTSPFTPGNGEEEGDATSATNSYDFTGLTEGITYYVSIQTDCGVDGVSVWSTPISFTTPSPGQTCEVALPITGLPYTTTDNTSNYGDNYDGSPGATGCGTTSSYLNGDDVVYSFTADFDGIVNLSMTPTNTWSGVFVYESCANIGVACYAGQANSTSTERNFDFNVINGNTYYIVISTFATPQNTGYTLTLTQVTCPNPSGLVSTNLTATSVDISWTAGDAETSWNIEWGISGFTPGTGAETGADVSATESFNITGLAPETTYHIYVQADCGVDDGTSEWIGPISAFTGYCSAGPTSTSDSEILGVTLNGAASSINNPTPCPAVTGLRNFTAQTVVLVRGETYDLNVLMGTCGGSYTNTIKAWIDYNQDLTLEEPAERLGVFTQATSVAGVNGTLNFTVPLTASLGNTRLRVMMRETGTETLVTPCATFTWGSAHDYTVEIIDGPATPPTPEQDAAVPTCDTGTDLSVTGTPDTGIEWYWQESADGTETDNMYSGPYTVFANGTYYLRAYDPTYDLWSDASSVTVSNFPLVADLPPAPVAGANPVCIVGTEITMPAADPGFEYYWQTIENGTSSANNADTPWDITVTGTYYVATFETATNCWSETSSITVVVDTYVPGAPTVTESVFNICANETTLEIEAEAPSSGTQTIVFGENINWAVGTTIFTENINLPNGATITSSTLTINGVSTFSGTWLSDLSFNLSGVATHPTTYLPGTGATNAGPFTYPVTVSGSGSTTLTLTNDWFTDATAQSIILEVTYDVPASTIAWYDAALGGSEIGLGSPFETIGTSVMNSPAENGIYEFYAGSAAGACISEDRTLVTINVNAVKVELAAIDVTCNGGDNGSFEVTNIECGVEPFSYSVDGGAFGPIPTNLTVGMYTILVQDNNGDESAEVFITILQPETVTDLAADPLSFEEIELSWNTTGNETEWVIEYGQAGFALGSGTTITVSQNPVIIDGLDDQTTYDFYVSPLCSGGLEGDQTGPISATTFCVPLMAQGFCENFASDSETQDCWTVINANGDIDAWDMNYTFNPYSGDQVAVLYTDFNAGNNDDWLISPQLTLTGNEVLNFFYRVQSAFEPNDFRVMLSTTGTNPADFTVTLMDLASYDNTVYQDTSVNLSDYTGNVFIAWHVPPGGLDGWRLYIDQVCIDICAPTPSQDGAQDICRLDGTIDLNTVIVPGEANGLWSFDANPSLLNGSILNTSALPSGTYQPMYVVTTACPEEADTVYATINVYGPSSAGNNGTVQTCNFGPLNLFDGLTGTVDLGGTWYDPAGNPIAGTVVNFSGQIPANYNYYYITTNNVCPADTAFVEVQLINCASISENELSGFALYPNPTSDVVYIQYSGVSTTVDMVLVDTKGSIVYNDKVNLASNDNYEIDLSKLVKGVYFLNIYSEDGSKVIKVVRN